jgi:hypothetical protein
VIISTSTGNDILWIDFRDAPWLDVGTIERMALPIVQEHRPLQRELLITLNSQTHLSTTRDAFLREHGVRLAREIESHAVGVLIAAGEAVPR